MSSITAFTAKTELPNSEFDQLFREHHALVYRTAFSVTRSAEDAEDVLQSVFLKLVRRKFPPDLKKNPKGYLYRAALNTAVDLVKARQREVLTGEAERFADAVPQEPEFAEEAERLLYDAIATLHPTAVQVLMLRYVHNHSVGQIATLLGTTRSTVAVSLFRSRVRLRKLIRTLGAKS